MQSNKPVPGRILRYWLSQLVGLVRPRCALASSRAWVDHELWIPVRKHRVLGKGVAAPCDPLGAKPAEEIPLEVKISAIEQMLALQHRSASKSVKNADSEQTVTAQNARRNRVRAAARTNMV